MSNRLLNKCLYVIVFSSMAKMTLAQTIPISCPKIDDRSNIMVNDPKLILDKQKDAENDPLGISSELSAAIKTGRFKGATAYDVMYELTDPGIFDVRMQGLTLIITKPLSYTTKSPFYVPLKSEEIDCLLRPGVQVLLSDGTYVHFSDFWRIDRAHSRYGIADAHYKEFFLHNADNLLGINSIRETTKEGIVVDWLDQTDFRDVFKGAHYLGSSKDFDAILQMVPEIDRKWRVAYAGFLTYIAFSSPLDVWRSLKYADYIIDNQSYIDLESIDSVKANLFLGLLTTYLLSQQLEIKGTFDPDIVLRIAKKIYPDQSIFYYHAPDKSIIVRLEDNKFLQGLIRVAEETIAERLARYSIEDNSFAFAEILIKTSKDVHPENVRFIAYEGELALKGLDAKEALPIAKSSLEKIERKLLDVSKSRNIEDFAEESFKLGGVESWTTVKPAFDKYMVISSELRKSAEDARNSDIAAFAAERELLALLIQKGPEFCGNVVNYVRDSHSRILPTFLKTFFQKGGPRASACSYERLSVVDKHWLDQSHKVH